MLTRVPKQEPEWIEGSFSAGLEASEEAPGDIQRALQACLTGDRAEQWIPHQAGLAGDSPCCVQRSRDLLTFFTAIGSANAAARLADFR